MSHAAQSNLAYFFTPSKGRKESRELKSHAGR